MKIAILGRPKSGKTTIFNALTGMNKEVGAFTSGEFDIHQAVVEVRDQRVTWLSGLYNPKKTIYATIEYMDYAGVGSVHDNTEGIPAPIQSSMKTADTYAVVIRNFEDSIIDDIAGSKQPLADITAMEEEMILSDQIVIEKRLEKIELAYKRGQKTPQLQLEEKVLLQMQEHLNELLPLRTLSLGEAEEKTIRGFQFLSLKPMLIILNSGEDNYRQNAELIASIEAKYPCIEFAGKFEMELIGLAEDEASVFMEDMGITVSARDLLTQVSYRTLGYISFFTVGPDEVRAWTITDHDNAVEAAGKIHSDLARGFIRAECFNYQDLHQHGSEKALRDKGLFRLEGKSYLVKDGDILNIRFSV